MAGPTGSAREIAVATPLGDDAVVLVEMRGEEHLSRPFEFELTVLSEDRAIDPDTLLGENLTVRLAVHGDGDPRYFNGVVTQVAQLPETSGRHALYRLSVRPWLWFLTQTADCRIFQESTVPDIVKEVIRGHGFSDLEDRLQGTYRTWEYCVQYRETDFNFVSRLLEQEGIYYYFLHENGAHKLVLADAPAGHDPVSGYDQVPYFPLDPGTRRNRDHVWRWVVRRRIHPGRYSANSFDFKAPRKVLTASGAEVRAHGHAGYEIYDYPGDYTEASDGQNYADVRMQGLACEHEVIEGAGDARGLLSGATFELTGFGREDQNRRYLLRGVSHVLRVDGYESGAAAAELQYECTFTAMDASEQFRAPQVARKPRIRGPQTAMVVGASGDEIHSDAFGRVKVRFPWDRYAEGDQTSSCWIRVSQVAAGQGWGGIVLPRVGQEVIVEHIEGDPDRPIITGRVYNGDNRPPYPLPDQQHLSTLKTNSTKGGGGFNELRFDDTKGEEQVFLHAQKNLDIRVLNDRYENVGADAHLKVEKDRFEEVGNDRHEKVGADHVEQVGKDRHLSVKGLEAKHVSKSLSLQVDGSVAEEFKKDHSESVSGDYYLTGTNVVIEGSTNITLKVGGSSIAISAQGVKIKTSGTVALEGTMIEVKGQATTKVEGGAKAEFTSGGVTIVKGTLVQIN